MWARSWGTAMEPTLLVFDEEQQVMDLGTTVEAEQNTRQESKERETALRIQRDIIAALCTTTCPTQQELLEIVKGKTTTKLAVLGHMVADGRVKEESEGRSSRRYRAVVPAEKTLEAGIAITPTVRVMDSFLEKFRGEVR
jgi:hypothetical protein